jgi:MFS transporter, DHA2 family, multidrug resistance protein
VNFIRQLGGAAGTNLIVVWLQLRTSFHSDVLTTTQTAANATSREFIGRVGEQLDTAGIPEALHYPLALDYLGKVVYAQAQTMGFKDSFLLLAVVFLLALLPAWLLRKVHKKR